MQGLGTEKLVQRSGETKIRKQVEGGSDREGIKEDRKGCGKEGISKLSSFLHSTLRP